TATQIITIWRDIAYFACECFHSTKTSILLVPVWFAHRMVKDRTYGRRPGRISVDGETQEELLRRKCPRIAKEGVAAVLPAEEYGRLAYRVVGDRMPPSGMWRVGRTGVVDEGPRRAVEFPGIV